MFRHHLREQRAIDNVEFLELIEIRDEVRQRGEAKKRLIADLLVHQHVTDRHQTVTNGREHFRALVAERTTRMQRDHHVAVGDFLHGVRELLNVLRDVILSRPC